MYGGLITVRNNSTLSHGSAGFLADRIGVRHAPNSSLLLVQGDCSHKFVGVGNRIRTWWSNGEGHGDLQPSAGALEATRAADDSCGRGCILWTGRAMSVFNSEPED